VPTPFLYKTNIDTSRWRFVAIWCQNGGALKLKRYIEMTLFNGLLAKKQLNQTGAFLEIYHKGML